MNKQSTYPSRHFSSVVLSLILASTCIMLKCSRLSSSAAEMADSRHVCGRLSIQPTQSEFKSALAIKYRISLDEDRYCIPSMQYPAVVKQAFAVELRTATGIYNELEELDSALAFVRVPKCEERLNPFGGPELLSVAEGGPIIYDVPPGEYRLAVKYRRGDCKGKSFQTVCVVLSDPFLIKESEGFVQEN